jgi:methylated-DNA-[protein]-cysteine S-methyltransferase
LNALTEIPYGYTWSYKQVAEHVGYPDAARAVGQANNSNDIIIFIPCHRVIQADGGLGGYNYGLWRKEWLLLHEQNFKDK